MTDRPSMLTRWYMIRSLINKLHRTQKEAPAQAISGYMAAVHINKAKSWLQGYRTNAVHTFASFRRKATVVEWWTAFDTGGVIIGKE